MNNLSSYEEQFTAFVDLLGFGDASCQIDDEFRLKILDLLRAIADLRDEFSVNSEKTENGARISIAPTVSTFSDHIVISYPINATTSEVGLEGNITPILIMRSFNGLLSSIAAAALRIGFLVRGGASIGELFHSQGVVFGRALVDAYKIESEQAIYPRVVLSNTIVQNKQWMEHGTDLIRGNDGLCYFNYYSELLTREVEPGPDYKTNLKNWVDRVVETVGNKINEYDSQGNYAKLAKWVWFAQELRKRVDPRFLEAFGLPPNSISWPSLAPMWGQ